MATHAATCEESTAVAQRTAHISMSYGTFKNAPQTKSIKQMADSLFKAFRRLVTQSQTVRLLVLLIALVLSDNAVPA